MQRGPDVRAGKVFLFFFLFACLKYYNAMIAYSLEWQKSKTNKQNTDSPYDPNVTKYIDTKR